MKPFELFRPGTHLASCGTEIAFSAEDVAATAAAYDTALHEAPIVIGHPAPSAPAYGWIEALSCEDGALVAAPAQVEPAFAELVAAGRYKKVSASFYRPGAAANPAPRVWYLRHVGFLGAQPPAVKGLRPIELAEADGSVSIEFGEVSGWTLAIAFRRLRDFLIAEYGAEKADAALPGDVIDSITAQTAMPDRPAPASAYQEGDDDSMTTDLAAREAAVQEAGARLAAEREALATEQRAFAEARRRRSAAEFVEGLVKQGRVLPRDQAGITALVARLDGEAEAAAFGEGEARTAGQYLRAYLSAQPVQVEFRELAADDGNPPPDGSGAKAIAQRAVAWQEEQRTRGVVLAIDEAVAHVMREQRR